MKNLKPPTSQLTEVLYYLLNRQSISVRQMLFESYILNLNARLSDLRLKYNIGIKMVKTHRKNKFKRPISYGTWRLTDKEHALTIYNKLTK